MNGAERRSQGERDNSGEKEKGKRAKRSRNNMKSFAEECPVMNDL